jgi:hypothetical protein
VLLLAAALHLARFRKDPAGEAELGVRVWNLKGIHLSVATECKQQLGAAASVQGAVRQLWPNNTTSNFTVLGIKLQLQISLLQLPLCRLPV